MAIFKDNLQQIKLPESLSSRENQALLVEEGILWEAIANQEPTLLAKILEQLASPEIQAAIERGELTLGMIKPALAESTVLDPKLPEDLQSRILIDQIQPPLEVVFEIVLPMDKELIEEWYEGTPKEAQAKAKPYLTERYGKTFITRWDEYVALMERGPVTFLLLYDATGNAVKEWRKQMGSSWNVEKVRVEDPISLRARLATDNHNNIVHGSDSAASVTREIGLVRKLIEKNLEPTTEE